MKKEKVLIVTALFVAVFCSAFLLIKKAEASSCGSIDNKGYATCNTPSSLILDGLDINGKPVLANGCYKWSCLNSETGGVDECSLGCNQSNIVKSGTPVCGLLDNVKQSTTCANGQIEKLYANDFNIKTGHYEWLCVSEFDKTNKVNCVSTNYEKPVCGLANNNLCLVGNYKDHGLNIETGVHEWACDTNSGTDVLFCSDGVVTKKDYCGPIDETNPKGSCLYNAPYNFVGIKMGGIDYRGYNGCGTMLWTCKYNQDGITTLQNCSSKCEEKFGYCKYEIVDNHGSCQNDSKPIGYAKEGTKNADGSISYAWGCQYATGKYIKCTFTEKPVVVEPEICGSFVNGQGLCLPIASNKIGADLTAARNNDGSLKYSWTCANNVIKKGCYYDQPVMSSAFCGSKLDAKGNGVCNYGSVYFPGPVNYKETLKRWTCATYYRKGIIDKKISCVYPPLPIPVAKPAVIQKAGSTTLPSFSSLLRERSGMIAAQTTNDSLSKIIIEINQEDVNNGLLANNKICYNNSDCVCADGYECSCFGSNGGYCITRLKGSSTTWHFLK